MIKNIKNKKSVLCSACFYKYNNNIINDNNLIKFKFKFYNICSNCRIILKNQQKKISDDLDIEWNIFCQNN
jgi:hypothetical protein